MEKVQKFIKSLLPYAGLAFAVSYASGVIYLGAHWVSLLVLLFSGMMFLALLRRGKEVETAEQPPVDTTPRKINSFTRGYLRLLRKCQLSKYAEKVEANATKPAPQPVQYETIPSDLEFRRGVYRFFWLYSLLMIPSAAGLEAIKGHHDLEFSQNLWLWVWGLTGCGVYYFLRHAWFRLGFDKALAINMEDIENPL